MINTSQSITLQHGPWRLEVDPLVGGSVCNFWHDQLAILRPAPTDATHAGQMAAFPLLPYSNRIGHKAFDWRGRHYMVRNGFDNGPHGLHGVGFMHPWQVVAQTTSRIGMRLAHPGDAYWPFAFVAEQHLVLHDHGLHVQLSLRNTDAQVQPAGLGWHPYFVRRAGVELQGADVHTQWLCDATLLPTQAVARPGLNGPVAQHQLDHCFSGGQAFGFADSVLSVVLHNSSVHWVVFTPTELNFFCIEPVTHVNNAVQMNDPLAHGLVALARGETMTQTIDLQVNLRGTMAHPADCNLPPH